MKRTHVCLFSIIMLLELAIASFVCVIKTSDQQSDVCIIADNIIRRWRKELREVIETRYGLLDELLGIKVLSAEQVETVRVGATIYEQCDLLLDIIDKKTPAECVTFVEALRSTGQVHVANFIEQNGGKCIVHLCVLMFTWPTA